MPNPIAAGAGAPDADRFEALLRREVAAALRLAAEAAAARGLTHTLMPAGFRFTAGQPDAPPREIVITVVEANHGG